MIEPSAVEYNALLRLAQENERRVHFLTENISDGFFTLDAELRCTQWNKAAERLTGIVQAGTVGKSIGEILGPGTDQTALESFFCDILGSRQTHSSIFCCRIGEKNLLLAVTACRSVNGISAVARDVAANEKAEQAMHRLASIVECSEDAIFSTTCDGVISTWNRAAEQLYGYTEQEILGKSFSTLIPSHLRKEQMAMHRSVLAGKGFQAHETQRLRKDGTALDISLSVSPILDVDGVIIGTSAIARDIGERKQAELAHDELASRLLNAQEAERTRIARELHDGIGQSLALLNIQLQRLSEPSRSAAKPQEIQELSAKLKHIGERVSKLSHQLHSSELEFLGLAVAIKGLCREFSQQYRIDVACTCRDVPAELDENVALCLLRVTQEALHNMARHSRARSGRVQLVGTGEELTCTISDDGIGFDTNKARKAPGLGLVSMRERMHLVGGQFTIRSSKSMGTTIEAKAPLSSTAVH
jgi:PAS domain S-box-containing protein